MAELQKDLDLRGALTLTILCASWGLNQAVMKYAYQDVSPVLSAAIRSAIAVLCLGAYCRFKGYSLKCPELAWRHKAAVVILFSSEFIFLYIGMDLTLSSRGSVLLYSQPFFTALMAHFMVEDDQLNFFRSVGLLLAFAGVAFILMSRPATGQASLLGDLFCTAAGFLWALTSIWIRKYTLGKASAFHVLYWQLLYSVPILVGAAFILEDPFLRITVRSTWTLLYQGVAVAFVSYLIWFSMFKRYKVSSLGAFTFLAPVFGVFTSKMLNAESLTIGLILGLMGVSLGVWLVNRS